MKRQNGFTLMELMVVVAIIGILSAVAVPNFISYRSNQRLGASAREILAAVKDTRLRAINEQATTVITFDVANDSYLAFVDDGNGSADGDLDGVLDGAGNGVQDGTEVTITFGALPGDIDMISASFGFLGPENRFNLLGRASANGSVNLTNSSGQTWRVTVLISGNARIVIP